jgi:hypothetical protein
MRRRTVGLSIPLLLAAFGGVAWAECQSQSQTESPVWGGGDRTTVPAPSAPAVLRVEADAGKAQIAFLSWDTEGGDRAEKNLLRSPAILRWRAAGRLRTASNVLPQPGTLRADGLTRCRIGVAPGAELNWLIQSGEGRLSMTLSGGGPKWNEIDGVEMIFPFDPGLTPTTVLPAECEEDGHLHLPAIVSAPDFGQMLLSCTGGPGVMGRLEGSRAKKTVDFIIEIPAADLRESRRLELRPVYLPPPEPLRDAALWRAVRRGWFGAFQVTSKWGEAGKPFSSPPGLLGNNVLSDPASVSLWFYADQAFWTPELAPGVSAMKMVRRTLEYWLDRRTRATGEVVGYWEYGGFLDANAGPLIAAWDYVEATNDRDWLAKWIGRLEFIADFLARRDVDGDGMIEATQSGNRGTLKQPGRSCAWWDAVNCGYKDGYTNAITYRAFRCLADLEHKAGRAEPSARYTRLADHLKTAYVAALYNPRTGWLGWWRSQDGELHDYATPIVNGLAIEYGLVEPAQGREILGRLRARMKEAGFVRFDLGIPSTLVPVARADYLLPDSLGCPKKEDGADTFGQYQNGGISAGQALHFLAAHYVVGEPKEADSILRAMLGRQARGGFQNGVRDAARQGIDWTTWDGKACGYEGYLADSFRFLQAVLLREATFRDRFYRPLTISVRGRR